AGLPQGQGGDSYELVGEASSIGPRAGRQAESVLQTDDLRSFRPGRDLQLESETNPLHGLSIPVTRAQRGKLSTAGETSGSTRSQAQQGLGNEPRFLLLAEMTQQGGACRLHRHPVGARREPQG